MDKKFNLLLLIATLSFTGCRIGLEPAEWEIKELGKKIQTNSTSYYLDGDYYYRELSTDLEGKKESVTAFKLGIGRPIVGDDDLNFKIGADFRFNPGASPGNYKDGIQRQASIDDPDYEVTSVFTQVIPGTVTSVPFLGLEMEWSEDFSLGFELGFPYMEWKVRSGHYYDEYGGNYQERQADSWKGFGIRYQANAYFDFFDEKEIRLIISAFYEEYEPEFAGEKAEIYGSGIYIGLENRF